MDVNELRRDVRAVVVPLIGPIDGAGVHEGEGGGSDSMINEDLCLPRFEALVLLEACVPLAYCEVSSADDLMLSAGAPETLLLMFIVLILNMNASIISRNECVCRRIAECNTRQRTTGSERVCYERK